MEKGKKYPYMKKMKQINIYLPNSVWKTIEKNIPEGWSRNELIKRAIINYIGGLLNGSIKINDINCEENVGGKR